jgi:Polysaccharide pyruvyl transferase
MPPTFILGINEAIDGSAYLPTKVVYDLTGQNTGNLAFHYALAKILPGTQDALGWSTPPPQLNAMRRIGVLPLANQLGPHADYAGLAAKFGQLDIPLVAVGLGAQGGTDYALAAVPPGTQAWIKEIAGRSPLGAPNIGVRGAYTLGVLEQYGLDRHAVVTGCPSLFINPDPKLGAAIEKRARQPIQRIAVAAGHQGWKHLGRIEASLTRMLDDLGGSYIVQSPIEMVALARGEAETLPEADLIACRDYARPGASLPEFIRWSRQYARAFFNVSEWMEHLRGVDFVVGARIHGVMLGLQAGVPGLCIAHDSRTRETMGVPFVMASEVMAGLTLEDIRARCVFDGAAFDARRRDMAARLDEFLRANDIAVSAWLRRIISGD